MKKFPAKLEQKLPPELWAQVAKDVPVNMKVDTHFSTPFFVDGEMRQEYPYKAYPHPLYWSFNSGFAQSQRPVDFTPAKDYNTVGHQSDAHLSNVYPLKGAYPTSLPVRFDKPKTQSSSTQTD
jgi:hypothetical protein